jgi:hypothetical protein
MMSGQKKYAIAAILVGSIDIAWLFASYFPLVQSWIETLRRSGQVGAALGGLVINPLFNLLVMCTAVYLAYRAWRMRRST